jgi:hypothetical protein
MELIGKRKKYRMRIRGYFECEAISKGEAMDIFEAIIPEHDFVYYIDEKVRDYYTENYEVITEKDWCGIDDEDV